MIGRIRAQMQANDPNEFLKAYQMFAEADVELADRVSAITHRTLVLTGELDTGSTPAMMTAMAGEMANAQAFLLRGLAHMAPVEDPDTVAAALEDFLDAASKDKN